MLAQQIQQLRGDEGKYLRVYDDATAQFIVPSTNVQGHPTIGIGRALDVHGISDDECEYLFNNDIKRVEQQLLTFNWFRDLNDVRKGVCINMAFNMGVSGLLEFRHMIALIYVGDFDGAADEMANSVWWHQIQSSRKYRLQTQMRTGIL